MEPDLGKAEQFLESAGRNLSARIRPTSSHYLAAEVILAMRILIADELEEGRRHRAESGLPDAFELFERLPEAEEETAPIPERRPDSISLPFSEVA